MKKFQNQNLRSRAKQQALDSINKSEQRGKATMSAKYAAKAIKALMKNGTKAWDKMIKR